MLVVTLATGLDMSLGNRLVEFLVSAAATTASPLDLVVLAHDVMEGAIVEVGATLVLFGGLVHVVDDDLLLVF